MRRVRLRWSPRNWGRVHTYDHHPIATNTERLSMYFETCMLVSSTGGWIQRVRWSQGGVAVRKQFQYISITRLNRIARNARTRGRIEPLQVDPCESERSYGAQHAC